MNGLDLIVFLLVSYSLTYGLIQSKLGQPIREIMTKINEDWLGYMVNCPFCSGFWIGLFVNIFIVPIENYNIFALALLSAISSSMLFFFHSIMAELLTYLIKRN